LVKGREALCSEEFSLEQQPKPELRFVRLFLDDAHLGDELLA